MRFPPNPGKKIMVRVDREKWARYPVKTHFITTKDSMDTILKKYVLPYVKSNDIIVLGQKLVSILQGKIVYKKDLRVGFWAKFLSRFVRKTPHGFSVGNPLKMQVALQLAGLPRILLASICGGICKAFGAFGVFYKIAGHKISQLDGFYGEAFQEYTEIGILGPENCNELCQDLKKRYKIQFLVADVNDLGVNILGVAKELKGKELLMSKVLVDNPAGQSNYQTPILILRKIK